VPKIQTKWCRVCWLLWRCSTSPNDSV